MKVVVHLFGRLSVMESCKVYLTNLAVAVEVVGAERKSVQGLVIDCSEKVALVAVLVE